MSIFLLDLQPYSGSAIHSYMAKTAAYEEILDRRCPLTDNTNSVQTLLDNFVTKNAITKKQRNQLCPKLDELELGHYHGLPKPYKVNLCPSIYSYLFIFFSLSSSYSLIHHYDLS